LYSSWLASRIVAFELDLGLRVLEIEAGVNLFARLVDRIFHFLKLYLADYVEAIVGCHFFTSKKECRPRIAWIKSG
jgi:hypothetical protein